MADLLTLQEDETKNVDDDCQSKSCKVRRKNSTIREVLWICCDECDDWHHAPCAKLPDTITEHEIENMHWVC